MRTASSPASLSTRTNTILPHTTVQHADQQITVCQTTEQCIFVYDEDTVTYQHRSYFPFHKVNLFSHKWNFPVDLYYLHGDYFKCLNLKINLLCAIIFWSHTKRKCLVILHKLIEKHLYFSTWSMHAFSATCSVCSWQIYSTHCTKSQSTDPGKWD